ncbi:sushi, nidogen and EGF-like domain-containing protein 1 [Elysia marginata]|uniref:Sushi, nidogen and EGF-like domain-containing protein 1 n=1 Tax=Elysia marginata TaxID=1093978 RepID=A0AAV4JFU9_9GAST|nr:sushi, nidogen and EGF-like domain-containing protein 1 [Elysia marginata]
MRLTQKPLSPIHPPPLDSPSFSFHQQPHPPTSLPQLFQISSSLLLFVNNNGIISFLNELRSYSPQKFPLSDSTPVIAPYWADVDVSDDGSGLVWYRQTTNPNVLAQANREIRAHQQAASKNFQAAWVFVVTWDEVCFYGPVGEGRFKRNTFQAVLVVDDTGDKSFVIFNYARLDWTTGSNSLGNEMTGLGGTPAQAGFNAGDMENFYEIEGSREAAIINLTQTSNVEIPGKWIFRVDSAQIEEMCPVSKNVIDVKPQLQRHNPELWRVGDEREVKVSWNSAEVDVMFQEAMGFSIEILEYRVANGSGSLVILWSKDFHDAPDNTYTLQMPKSFSKTKMSVAVVRVTALVDVCESKGPSIFSDVFPVRPLLASAAASQCSAWLTSEANLSPLSHQDNTQCPCTLKQAEGDTAQFSPDPFCRRDSNSVLNCRYRPRQAVECILPNRISYMLEDIVPRLHCCEYSTDETLCDQYLKYRPPVTCQQYQAPSAAQAAGDPHMETLDGHAYTFNGLGSFTLLKVKDSTAVVQVKATRAKNTQGQLENATVFTGLAVRSSGADSPVLELALASDNVTLYQFYVNGQLQDGSRAASVENTASGSSDSDSNSNSSAAVPVLTTWQAGGISVVESRLANQQPEIRIVLDDLGLSLLVEVMEELINIIAVTAPQLKGKLEGLLGNYNGDSQDDFLSRDDVLVPASASMREVHNRFGMSWQVWQNESLFTQVSSADFLVAAEAQLAQEEEKNFTPEYIDEEMSTERGYSGVAGDGMSMDICEGNTQCMFDLQVTKNENIALSTLKFNKRFEELKSEIKPVVRCPHMADIPNANRTLTGLKENDTVTFTCYHGYQMETGGSMRVLMCLNTNQWSAERPKCVRVVDTSEDFPIIYVAAGAAAGAFLLVFVLSCFIRVVHRRFTRPWSKKSDSSSSMDYEQAIELPTLFPISDIPSPVFENPLFLQRLQQLCDKGSFQIPRPTYVDPNIYSEYF